MTEKCFLNNTEVGENQYRCDIASIAVGRQ